jgi:TolB-like protein
MPEIPRYQRFFADLKRRRVFGAMAVYGAVAFGAIQVVDIVLPRLGLPDWTVTFVVWVCLLGFPVAMLLAWAFERTPEGLRLTDDAKAEDLDAIVAEPAARRWSSGLLALLGVVALVTGAWWVGRTTAMADAGFGRPTGASAVLQRAYADLADDVRPAIAVLPFSDFSPSSDQQYFADGVSEELVNALVKVQGLRVTGRTSSFAYRNVEKDLREIGSELGVEYLVEGSVRKQGDRLRITAQLVDAGDNFHVWSEAYNRTLDDVFTVQEEIAGAIAERLQVSLGLEQGRALVAPTADIEAYDLYLRAKALVRERGRGIREAVTLLEEVVARDSTWAPGWAALALAHSLVPYYQASGHEGMVAPELWESALGSAVLAAERALALDPRVAGADVALGNAYRDRWEWERAESHYIRALEIDPDDVEAHQQYTELLAATGREDEALRSARRAVALDPTSAIRLIELGLVLYLNGRNAEAVLQLELAIVRDPELAPAYTTLALARMGLGEVDEAERLWREEYIPRLDLGEAARIDWDQTLAARFEAIRNQDSKAYARCCAEFNVALDWLMVGDTARAIRTISEAVLQSARFDARLFYSLWLPGLDGIRNDPRFQEALSEALELAGLSGATLRRAQGTE